MNQQAAAYIGKELSALIRAHHAGQRVAAQDLCATLHRMMMGEASTPSDALALLVAAQPLMAQVVSRVPPLEESEDGLVEHCVLALLSRAIEALEVVSGERADTFTGCVPAMN